MAGERGKDCPREWTLCYSPGSESRTVQGGKLFWTCSGGTLLYSQGSPLQLDPLGWSRPLTQVFSRHIQDVAPSPGWEAPAVLGAERTGVGVWTMPGHWRRTNGTCSLGHPCPEQVQTVELPSSHWDRTQGVPRGPGSSLAPSSARACLPFRGQESDHSRPCPAG